MELTPEEQDMAAGKYGNATQKAMEILVALGEIYGAKRLIDITSVQIAGVSYANLNEPGMKWLESMAKDGEVRVFTTLNPAGKPLAIAFGTEWILRNGKNSQLVKSLQRTNYE
jgi:predicted aconitase